MANMPVEPPTPAAIARELSGMVALLRPDRNFERVCLEEAHRLLSEVPPNIGGASAEIAQGMAHAFRGSWVESRPETWLVAACAHLLSEA